MNQSIYSHSLRKFADAQKGGPIYANPRLLAFEDKLLESVHLIRHESNLLNI